MAKHSSGGRFSRRDFLEVGSGALVATAATSIAAAQTQSSRARDNRSQSDPGPKNPPLDAQNPDAIAPPSTDAGGVPPFQYPFSLAHKRIHQGGWSREVTMRELAVAKSLAGVNMRLTAGGIRELHWHNAAEWAFMLYGSARITAIDSDGKSFVADVGKNDLWYFPTGIPHSIQGLGPDGAEFLLVFDDGAFSEYATVLLSEWMAHTPKSVLAKNFGVQEAALQRMPTEELFIFQAGLPGPLEEDQKAAARGQGLSTDDFAFRTLQAPVTKRTRGGEVRIIDSNVFKSSKNIAAALVTVRPGGVRELHWHPNADEWQYYISGQGRMTVFAMAGRARTADFRAGDVGYVQQSMPHYIENTGDTDLQFLEMFKASRYQDLSLSVWLTHTPPELVMAHLNIDRATLDAIPRDEAVNMPE
ncbi:MAG TPA: cupin domain-containing protein [Terriglobales bacterium]|nr:cupin domain-containing protein [Terriglobales bacterium]